MVNNDHYNTSKSCIGIDKDKQVKGRNYDRSDFDGTVPTTKLRVLRIRKM